MRPRTVLLALLLAVPVRGVDIDAAKVVDLTHPFDARTVYWPTEKGFAFESLARGDAAEFLVAEGGIKAIGVDTPSLDHGPSRDFIVHRIVNGADEPGLENLANLDRLPRAGATLIALPMLIAGGSGGPLRAIAVLP